ncbi:hypothetical protein HPB52_014192 [Rhipicephalus sanguineus]|uniref:Uncharacterized protein n=1 Tax=Rhipicephalus sanguineus TaxID=34632 RepID=A0A9D4QA87_RHISA|nr:hypothetical protein HPB52_014192 [Rhipicephalus sanguineus]
MSTPGRACCKASRPCRSIGGFQNGRVPSQAEALQQRCSWHAEEYVKVVERRGTLNLATRSRGQRETRGFMSWSDPLHQTPMLRSRSSRIEAQPSKKRRLRAWDNSQRVRRSRWFRERSGARATSVARGRQKADHTVGRFLREETDVQFAELERRPTEKLKMFRSAQSAGGKRQGADVVQTSGGEQ